MNHAARDAIAAARQLLARIKVMITDDDSTPIGVPVAAELGGRTFPPGVYTSDTSMTIIHGDVTLRVLPGQEPKDAFWIFSIGSAFSTDANSRVILANGAKEESNHPSKQRC
jgi:hypothetical protein